MCWCYFTDVSLRIGVLRKINSFIQYQESHKLRCWMILYNWKSTDKTKPWTYDFICGYTSCILSFYHDYWVCYSCSKNNYETVSCSENNYETVFITAPNVHAHHVAIVFPNSVASWLKIWYVAAGWLMSSVEVRTATCIDVISYSNQYKIHLNISQQFD